VNENKQMVAHIDKGMNDRDEVIFPEEASQMPGFNSGDVIFIIKQMPHDIFERIGDNLYAEIEITLQVFEFIYVY